MQMELKKQQEQDKLDDLLQRKQAVFGKRIQGKQKLRNSYPGIQS
jgi:hypothetical protein